jgi:transglutaminase-like putative cysteine protease
LRIDFIIQETILFMKALLFSLVLLAAFSAPAFADITNPQMVSSMTAQVIESGLIDVSGSVNSISLNLSVPQEDQYQSIDGFSVSYNGAMCDGSCSHGFVYDEFGNRLLNIEWKNPQEDISFEVRSIVSVSRRYSTDVRENRDFLLPTSLVQSTDPEIASVAEGARGTDFEKVSYLSKWISENIKYNTIYSDINIPAKEILRLRIGVCKEFSNLLVSVLRNLGYYSAVDVGYVHPGKVYSGGNFEPHGWVEAYSGEDGIMSDPTWGEVGYLDATHIKFATLPDSKWTFTSAYSSGFGSFKVSVVNTSVLVDLLSFEESPLLVSSSKLLDDGLSSGYAVMQTDLSSEHCILTKMDVVSCGSQDGQFLTRLNTGNMTYFCGSKSVFTIFKLPEIENGVQYTCPISVMVYGSDQETLSLTMSHGSGGSTRLSVDRTTASPNEKLVAAAQDSHIFTSDGDVGYDRLR